jgi:hypothetical protein
MFSFKAAYFLAYCKVKLCLGFVSPFLINKKLKVKGKVKPVADFSGKTFKLG